MDLLTEHQESCNSNEGVEKVLPSRQYRPPQYEWIAYCKDVGVIYGSCVLMWMPHISVDVGKDAMPTPWSLRASAQIPRLVAREAIYTSTGQNSKAMSTIVVETRMSEQGLVVSPVSGFSKHHQRRSG